MNHATTPTGWDPEQYLRYEHERSTRPLADLLHRVPHLRPPAGRALRILDIGCGPGSSTAELRRRWPDARITGLDNSEQMLATARASYAGPNPGGTGSTDYVLADARVYGPAAEEPDLIVANAVLQWLPDHLQTVSRWVTTLRPGGTLAFQLPGNYRAPSHTLLAALRTSPRWRGLLGAGAGSDAGAHEPSDYLALLAAHHVTADVWETTYHTVLSGTDPVLEWLKGTALRPVLTTLTDVKEREEFLAEYRDLLRKAYPRAAYGTVFPYRRVFAVARRPPA